MLGGAGLDGQVRRCALLALLVLRSLLVLVLLSRNELPRNGRDLARRDGRGGQGSGLGRGARRRRQERHAQAARLEGHGGGKRLLVVLVLPPPAVLKLMPQRRRLAVHAERLQGQGQRGGEVVAPQPAQAEPAQRDAADALEGVGQHCEDTIVLEALAVVGRGEAAPPKQRGAAELRRVQLDAQQRQCDQLDAQHLGERR